MNNEIQWPQVGDLVKITFPNREDLPYFGKLGTITGIENEFGSRVFDCWVQTFDGRSHTFSTHWLSRYLED
jgi:hypothetical protein